MLSEIYTEKLRVIYNAVTKGLVGLAAGLQRRREVGPLQKLFDSMDGVKGS
jgi:hypothetical protein